jgi:hypothetical protein
MSWQKKYFTDGSFLPLAARCYWTRYQQDQYFG